MIRQFYQLGWISFFLLSGCALVTANTPRSIGGCVILRASLKPHSQALVPINDISSIATLSIEPCVQVASGSYLPVSSVTGDSTTIEDPNRLRLSQASPYIDSSRPFVIRNLKPNKNYRIYGRAYNQANALISTDETAYVDVAVESNDAPQVATLCVALQNVLFGATTSVTVNTSGRFDYLKARVFKVSTGAEVMSAQTTRTASEIAINHLQANTNYSLWVEAYKLGSVMASQSLALNIGNDNAPATQSLSLTVPYVVGTLAGSTSGAADGAATSAQFNGPHDVAVDGFGNVYVADAANRTVRKIDAQTHNVSTLAGSAGVPGATDGTGAAARFNYIYGIAADGAGNVYVADSANNLIRKIDAQTNYVSTLAGSTVGAADGTGTSAQFNNPLGIAVDGSSNIYVADYAGHVIRKIDALTHYVSTLAGSAGVSGTTDGVGAAAKFSSPCGLAVDGAGNVYVTDYSSHLIRKIDAQTHYVSTLAGSAGVAGTTNGMGTSAQFNNPAGIEVDLAGNLYVADRASHLIRKIDAQTHYVSTLAGSGGGAGTTDGTGALARFNNPQGLAIDAAGNIYVGDIGNNRIRLLR